MIDTKAVDQPFCEQRKNLFMRRLEDFVVFDTQSDQVVDIEEAPPVDFIIGRSPPRQPEVLPLKQGVESLPSRRGGRCEGGKAGLVNFRAVTGIERKDAIEIAGFEAIRGRIKGKLDFPLIEGLPVRTP